MINTFVKCYLETPVFIAFFTFFFCKIDEFPHYQSGNFANSKGCKFHQLFCKYSKQRVRKLMNLAGQIIIWKKLYAGLRGSENFTFYDLELLSNSILNHKHFTQSFYLISWGWKLFYTGTRLKVLLFLNCWTRVCNSCLEMFRNGWQTENNKKCFLELPQTSHIWRNQWCSSSKLIQRTVNADT